MTRVGIVQKRDERFLHPPHSRRTWDVLVVNRDVNYSVNSMFSEDGQHLIHVRSTATCLGTGRRRARNHRQQGCWAPSTRSCHQYEVCCIKTYQD